LGRATGPNDLPPDVQEMLLLGCSGALLISPPHLSDLLLGTVMLFWKEQAAAPVRRVRC